MTKKLLFVTTLLLVVAIGAFAADVSGVVVVGDCSGGLLPKACQQDYGFS